MKKIILLFVLIILLGFTSCQKKKETPKTNNSYVLNNYWNQGKAEISVYKLSQNRYNNNHSGHLISVFVKEDFLTDKQVKNERYTNSNSTPILKNIQIRKFTTGVYDYSLFTSTFTPIDKNNYPKTLKVSASSQEWCGTIFTQFNYKNNKYNTQQFSYFENESDTQNNIEDGILEDEIFNTIRMSPNLLPKGNFKIIPAANYIQLKHLERKSFAAKAILKNYTSDEFKGNDLRVYQISIEKLNRKLKIIFEAKAPHKIQGWLDSFPSAFDKKVRTTKVILKKRKLVPYWSLNSLKDKELRKELGL